MRSRRLILAGVPTLAFMVLLAGAPAASAAQKPYCGIRWGSLPKTVLEYTGAPFAAARVGRHDCFDRFVIELAGKPAPGYDVRYVDAFRNEDTGAVVPVAGGAFLKVRAFYSDLDSDVQVISPWRFGDSVVTPGALSSGRFRTLRHVVYGGTYEGETTFVLGVRARLPFRAIRLDGPGGGSRLVIDVAHRW